MSDHGDIQNEDSRIRYAITSDNMHEYSGNRDERGLQCPKCECRHFLVTNTERLQDGRTRRRRKCRNCEYKMVTFENPPGWRPKE